MSRIMKQLLVDSTFIRLYETLHYFMTNYCVLSHTHGQSKAAVQKTSIRGCRGQTVQLGVNTVRPVRHRDDVSSGLEKP